jgi:hypothetical protein
VTPELSVTDHVLREAARIVGLDADQAELIRDGSHTMYRLPGDVVARVGRSGTGVVARREIEVSLWLTASGLPATQPVPELRQPTMVCDRPVTWWRLLSEHRPASPSELGSVLRALHALAIPTSVALPTADPFEGLGERVGEARNLGLDDQSWLVRHLDRLRSDYDRLALDKPRHVIHGDAWQGNVAVPASGIPILLDLEDVAIGRPEWDLVQLAVDYTDFARLNEQDYRGFVDAYGGYDITSTASFRVWADIQELRWTCFAISKSSNDPTAADEARHRIACLRGKVPRPWTWNAF